MTRRSFGPGPRAGGDVWTAVLMAIAVGAIIGAVVWGGGTVELRVVYPTATPAAVPTATAGAPGGGSRGGGGWGGGGGGAAWGVPDGDTGRCADGYGGGRRGACGWRGGRWRGLGVAAGGMAYRALLWATGGRWRGSGRVRG